MLVALVLIVAERTRYMHAQRSFRFLSGAP